MSYKNVVYEWNSICNHLGEKVAEEPMTGFAGEYEEGDDWSDDDIAEGKESFKVMDYGEIVVKTPKVVDGCSEWVMGAGATRPVTEAASGDGNFEGGVHG